MTIKVDPFDVKSINAAIKQIEALKAKLESKAKEICRRLAIYGATDARIGYSTAIYDGDRDVEIRVEETDNGYRIIAEGETVLFIEFGAGITYGYGHPQATEFGMGPGTWFPQRGMMIHGVWTPNWMNPNGWYFTDDLGEKHHTMGNAPSMTMYNTAQDLRRIVREVTEEVLKDDRY